MTKRILILTVLVLTLGYAETLKDQDFDGVPDSIDECKNTPFLNTVNHKGCTTDILTLPSETEKENLNVILSYGYSTNEDLLDREIQKNTKIKISYYLNSWSYSLQSGYYTHNAHDGTLDTILRIKKRVKINPKLAINIGTGLKLPTHDYEGNKVDGFFDTSIHYYPDTSFSLFAGYSFTAIRDDEVTSILPETPDNEEEGEEEDEYLGLRNTHKYYLGVGYFFNDSFYMNLIFNEQGSKFVSEHSIKTVSSLAYYKINTQWFATLYYDREILDDDLHDTLLFSIGYNIW